MNRLLAIFISFFIFYGINTEACTNFLITKGATKDGSTMITYLADSHTLYGELYFYPAKDYKDGEMLQIKDWDTGKPLGKIKQAKHTYQVIGNMNEHQLSIAESTYGGRPELVDTLGNIDYGSLIYIGLQRAKTAREAIKVMTDLVAEYGYASSGESFSIGDPNEVWILEMIGKGNGKKGAVWVARKVPDGYVCAHANHARITTFPTNDPENCLYAKDVISFAREKGYFKGDDKEFSFSDTYAPLDFSGARGCEGRVYAFFNRVSSGMNAYIDYAMGKFTTDKNGYALGRMPLWVKPTEKLDAKQVMDLMRDHYEGTPMDMTKDCGAGPFQLPYRWRPMTWTVDSVTYCHERAISTQQTGFSFVAQSRSWLPNAIGGVLWFGVDDSYTTCYAPIYCSITQTPECFKVGNGDMCNFSETSAFWTFNFVSNFAYSRYKDMIKDIQPVQKSLELGFIQKVAETDKKALDLYNANKTSQSKDLLTKFSVNTANDMTAQWKKLGWYLLVKYMDGNVKKEKDGKFELNPWGQPVQPSHPEYPQDFYKKIVQEKGDSIKVIENKK